MAKLFTTSGQYGRKQSGKWGRLNEYERKSGTAKKRNILSAIKTLFEKGGC